MTSRGAKISDQQKQHILDLHAQGHGRNEIMRRLQLSAGTVTGTVQDAGLSFERVDMSAAATDARRKDLQARRQALMVGLLEDAALMRTQLFAPMIAFAFGGRDNSYAEHQIPEPTTRDKRDLMQAITAAINAYARLTELDRGADAEGQKSALGELMRNLRHAWEAAHPKDGTDSETPS